MLQMSLLISGGYVTRLVLFHGPKSLRHIFYIYILNGMIDEDRTRRKQSLCRKPLPLPSDRDIPGNQQHLEVKV